MAVAQEIVTRCGLGARFCLYEGFGQGSAIAKLLSAQGQYEKIQILPDLTGRDRFALACRR